MENKKDIGKLFEKKLSTGKRIPTESLWKKINTSLDEEKRKKKRVLLYWWLGGGFSVILGLFLLFYSGKFSTQNSQIPFGENSLEQNSISNSEKENSTAEIKFSKEDSLQYISNDKEKNSKIKTVNKDSSLLNYENTTKINSKRKTQKGSLKQKSIDEMYTVSKKYYYYNSKDGKQIVTAHKNEIDSLVKQNLSLDSTATIKNDSNKLPRGKPTRY